MEKYAYYIDKWAKNSFTGHGLAKSILINKLAGQYEMSYPLYKVKTRKNRVLKQNKAHIKKNWF